MVAFSGISIFFDRFRAIFWPFLPKHAPGAPGFSHMNRLARNFGMP
jgi:hypothetical protein